MASCQLVSKDILQELEEMDKECDIDDILSYRSLAEQQLQVLFLTTFVFTNGGRACYLLLFSPSFLSDVGS